MLNAMFSIPMVQAISVKGLNTSLQTDYILKVYFSRLLVQSSISCLHLFFGEPLSILFFFRINVSYRSLVSISAQTLWLEIM